MAKTSAAHPMESNPFGMLALTRWGDNKALYINPGLIVSIERLPATNHTTDRTKLRLCPHGEGIRPIAADIALVNETPEEIFRRKDALDKRAR